MALTPVLTAHWDDPKSFEIESYKKHGGYVALKNSLKMTPDEVIGIVKDSGLRGRGGAGFQTGMRYSFDACKS